MTASSDSPRELYEVTGSYGPWQRGVFIVFFYINIVGIWQNLSITFLAPNVDFECATSNRSLINRSSRGLDDRCWVEVEGSTVPCNSWNYDTSTYSQTIVSEWDLVCEREWLVSLSKSVYMFGFLLSVLFFGQLSDCIGRYRTVVISYVVAMISQLLSLLSSSYLMFVILRFLIAFGRTGLTTVGFVLIMEMVGPDYRTEVGIGIQLGWSLGFVSLAALAYFVRHWFWLQVAMTVVLIPIVFTFKFIPESPRWLLMQGKINELEKVLKSAAKQNKKELKYEIKDLEILQHHLKSGKKTSTVFDLFRTKQMRTKTFNMLYLWVVNAFMYYGLTFNTNELAGNPYINFFLAGALEFPSYGLLFLLVHRLGRRPALVGLMLAGGIACALAPLPVPASVRTGLAQAGKFCVTASFGLLYLYTGELFPTVVRTAALGTCSCGARIGSILAPFVRELGKMTYAWVPDLLYTLLAVSSGLLALLLPETRGAPLSDDLPSDDISKPTKNGNSEQNSKL